MLVNVVRKLHILLSRFRFPVCGNQKDGWVPASTWFPKFGNQKLANDFNGLGNSGTTVGMTH
jgi:hypothetical protein